MLFRSNLPHWGGRKNQIELNLKWPGPSQCLKIFEVIIYMYLGEARLTRNRWPLGDEGKQAKFFFGGQVRPSIRKFAQVTRTQDQDPPRPRPSGQVPRALFCLNSILSGAFLYDENIISRIKNQIGTHRSRLWLIFCSGTTDPAE